MPLTTATRELVAIYFGTLGGYVSLHTADPSTTGAKEASVTRQQTTWAAGVSDGAVTGSQVTFTSVPAGQYPYLGVWSAVTGGTFRGSQALTDVELSATGEVKITPTYTQSNPA